MELGLPGITNNDIKFKVRLTIKQICFIPKLRQLVDDPNPQKPRKPVPGKVRSCGVECNNEERHTSWERERRRHAFGVLTLRASLPLLVVEFDNARTNETHSST